MNHYYLFFFISLLASSSVLAQTAPETRVEKKQFTYHMLAGISAEMGVARTSTVRVSGPVELGFVWQATSSSSDLYAYLRPVVNGEFRYYYNLDKRYAQGKRVVNNSANFIGPIISLYGPAIVKSDNISVVDFASVFGAVWGIQRNYGQRFNFQLSLGPGIGITEEETSFTPVGQLSFGFRIGK